MRVDQVPARASGVLVATVDDAYFLLLPRTNTFLEVEGSGASIWALIDGTRTVDAIVLELESEFAAPSGAIRVETQAFLEALVAAGFVTEV